MSGRSRITKLSFANINKSVTKCLIACLVEQKQRRKKLQGKKLKKKYKLKLFSQVEKNRRKELE